MQINRISNSPIQRNQNSKQAQPNFERLVYLRHSVPAIAGKKADYSPYENLMLKVNEYASNLGAKVKTHLTSLTNNNHRITLIDIPEETCYGDIENDRAELIADAMVAMLRKAQTATPDNMKVIDYAEAPENMLKVIDDTINIAKQ